MRHCRAILMILVQFWAMAGAGALAAAATTMKVLSLNCNSRRPGVVWDGQNPQGLPADKQKRIVAEIIKSGADVVLFQGLWQDKQAMADQLKGTYKYALASDSKDGLLIVSKWVPWIYRDIPFTGRNVYNQDTNLQKGAILAGLYNPTSYDGTVVVIDTNLQSGVDNESCSIREKQIQAMSYWTHDLSKIDARFQGVGYILAGDFNEPVTLQKAQGRIFDRTWYLVQRMNAWFLKVDNSQTIAALSKTYNIQDIVHVEQQREKGYVRKQGVGEPVATLTLGDPLVESFNADKGGWAYLPEATDASGCQILNQVYLTPGRCRLVSLKSLRGAFLGDQGAAKPSNPGQALTSQAPILAEIELPQ